MGRNKKNRVGSENYNKQQCLMKIIEYNNANDILIEFQDSFKTQKRTQWTHFINGDIKNFNLPTIYKNGIVGEKYEIKINNKYIKEFVTWKSMIRRCYDNNIKEKNPIYENVTCCKEWLYFPNFYDWLHSQENFEQWLNGKLWAMDKDILVKGNKFYSPETCCLVPHNINNLFIKRNKARGHLPIGISYNNKKHMYDIQCNVNGIEMYLGRIQDPIEGFYIYKNFKENLVKQIAQEEFDKSNITKKCYEAMMKYEVEITD